MSKIDSEDREEIALLLPWYASGTLDEEEMMRIDAALENDPTLQQELDLVLADQSAARQAAEEIQVPSSMEARFAVGLNQLVENASDRPQIQHSSSSGWLAALANWLAPPRRLAFAAGMAVLLLVVQSGAIITLLQDRPAAEFETATGGEDVKTQGVSVLVQFAPDTNPTAISALLESMGGRIVDGPLPGGLYKLVFSSGEDEKRDDLITELSEKTEVFTLVLPAQ
ncbi:MAG: hypothetical protein AAF468_09390 [Pseudomonadota bacterium]